MATTITITGETNLTITSDNPVIDYGNDGGGARVFRVNKPCNINPALSETQAHFKDGIVNINGLDFGGNGDDNEIVVFNQSDYVEILVRG